MNDYLIEDFHNENFQKAFNELGINVKDWDSVFNEISEDKTTKAYMKTDSNNEVIGFIMFQPIQFTSFFFKQEVGFIREFWVKDTFKNKGHGTDLIFLAEQYFIKRNIFKTILTTDTAERFYLKHGYQKDLSYKAINNDISFTKILKQSN